MTFARSMVLASFARIFLSLGFSSALNGIKRNAAKAANIMVLNTLIIVLISLRF
jgi:hypothetical protein